MHSPRTPWDRITVDYVRNTNPTRNPVLQKQANEFQRKFTPGLESPSESEFHQLDFGLKWEESKLNIRGGSDIREKHHRLFNKNDISVKQLLLFSV